MISVSDKFYRLQSYIFMQSYPQNNDSESRSSSESLLVDIDTSNTQEPRRKRPHPLVPKLPLNQLFEPRLPCSQIARSRSQKQATCPDQQVLSQARSIKYQSRFGTLVSKAADSRSRLYIQALSPDEQRQRSYRNMTVAESQILETEQQLKIKQMECEGLKAHLMVEKAKWETDKLLSERRSRRQQQEIDDLNRRITMIEGRPFREFSPPPQDDFSNFQSLASARSYKKFQKLELTRDNDRVLLTERRNALDFEERMAKLREIEIQQRKAAQSLMKIMGQIKGQTSRAGSHSKNPVKFSEKGINTIQSISPKYRQRSVSIFGIEEYMNQSTQGSQNIIAIKEQNCRLKEQFVNISKMMAGMSEDFTQLRQKLQSKVSILQANNKVLETDRNKLTVQFTEKERQIENLRLAYNELTKKMSQNAESSPAYKQQIEVLEYQNFQLKSKIQELTETKKYLQTKLDEDRVDVQKKLNELYGLVGNLQSSTQQTLKEKDSLAQKLRQSELLAESLQKQLTMIKKEAITNVDTGDFTEGLLKADHESQIFKLRKRIREQEDQIEQMSRNITELEEDMGMKQKQLSLYRNKKQAKRNLEDLEAYKVLANELEQRLLIQQQGHITQMQVSFSREQQCIDRLADRQIEVERLQNQVTTLRKFQQDLQKNCQQLSSTVQYLKDTNEKMYQQIKNLNLQRGDLQQKAASPRDRTTAPRTAIKAMNSNSLAIAEEENALVQQANCQYRRLVNELKGFIKQEGRLCEQLLSDIDKKETIQELNKANDALQGKLIEINFCSQFKGSLWESSQNRQTTAKAAQQIYYSQCSEGELNKSHASFIKQFLDKSDEKNAFNDQIQKVVSLLLGANSELGVLIHKFLMNLFHYPNHSYLFDQIQSFLCDVREYQQHIDTKFKNLQKSIGQYLNQANAVLYVGEASEVDPSASSYSSGVKSQDMHQKPVSVPFQGFQTEGRTAKQLFAQNDDIAPESIEEHYQSSQNDFAIQERQSNQNEELELKSNQPFKKDTNKKGEKKQQEKSQNKATPNHSRRFSTK